MTMNVVCVRPTPVLLGRPDNDPGIPVPELFPPLMQGIVIPEAAPLFINDFPLGRLATAYWLATLCRATYSSGAALFTQAARAVVPESYPITFVPNASSTVPGYGIIKLPNFLVVAISGTTNLAQWLSQIFLHDRVPTNYPVPGINDQAETMALYKTAADAIDTAIGLAAGDDRPVLLTGHSMGGAVATVLHYKYRANTRTRKASRCFTFCAPKPGDNYLSAGCRTGAQVFRRVAIQTDPIPGLPPALPKAAAILVPLPLQPFAQSYLGYEQVGVFEALALDGTFSISQVPVLPAFIAQALIDVGLGRPLTVPSVHLMRFIVQRMRAAITSSLPTADTRRWANPSVLSSVNDTMTAAGL